MYEISSVPKTFFFFFLSRAFFLEHADIKVHRGLPRSWLGPATDDTLRAVALGLAVTGSASW